MVLLPTTPEIPNQVPREAVPAPKQGQLKADDRTGETDAARRSSFARLLESLLPGTVREETAGLRSDTAPKYIRKASGADRLKRGGPAGGSSSEQSEPGVSANALHSSKENGTMKRIPDVRSRQAVRESRGSEKPGAGKTSAASQIAEPKQERMKDLPKQDGVKDARSDGKHLNASSEARIIPELPANITSAAQPEKSSAVSSGPVKKTEPMKSSGVSADHRASAAAPAETSAQALKPSKAKTQSVSEDSADVKHHRKPSRAEASATAKRTGTVSKADESEKKDEGVRFEVVDRRTSAAERAEAAGDLKTAENGGRQPAVQAAQPVPERTGAPSAFPEAGNAAPYGDGVALARYLTEEGNAEIVKNARFVLRNGDRGEIRLLLKPESMGSVRISLSMHEDHIAGRIIVENDTVREAFEQNLQSLVNAFAAEGFVPGNLEVSVGNDRRGNQDRQETARPRAAAVKEMERHTASAAYVHDGYLNLVV